MRAKVDKLVEQELKKRSTSLKRDALNFPANFEFFKVTLKFYIFTKVNSIYFPFLSFFNLSE
jgi:hypothetical protein